MATRWHGRTPARSNLVMQLYVIRHGIAGPSARSDADRELTAEGRRRLQAEARALELIGVRLDRLLHSPLVRAVQTAELLDPLLAPGGTRQAFEPLAHEPSTALFEELGGGAVALVGHEPWQSRLAGWLVSGERHGGGFALKPGGVIALEGSAAPAGMVLRGFWMPDQLVAIGTRT